MAKQTKESLKIVSTKEQVEVKKFDTKLGNIIVIPGVETKTLMTLLIGETPLIVHNFSQKHRDQILKKHMGEASGGRQKKDPVANFEAAKYVSVDGWEGIKASGLKGMLVKGFSKESGVPRTKAKGSVYVQADCIETNLVRLIYPKEPKHIAKRPHFPNEIGRVPRCREDVVRNESGVVDIRHRPEYWPWAVLLRIKFIPTVCSEKQLLQALAVAGMTDGQCEWRPGSKNSDTGTFGQCRMATEEEVQLFERDQLFSDYKWDRVIQEAAE